MVGSYVISYAVVLTSAFVGIAITSLSTWGSAMAQLTDTFFMTYYWMVMAILVIVFATLSFVYHAYFFNHKISFIILGCVFAAILLYPLWTILVS